MTVPSETLHRIHGITDAHNHCYKAVEDITQELEPRALMISQLQVRPELQT